MEYTGYIYIWYDTKAKFFYIGGHKGKVEDSYICSSKMMLRAYNKRPETFRLKILQYINGSNQEIREAEQYWLDKIKDEELYWTPNLKNKTTKYYNQKKHAAGGNGSANKGKLSGRKSWNNGLTKEMISLRRKKLFCVLSDKPNLKSKSKSKINLKSKSKSKIKKEKQIVKIIYNERTVKIPIKKEMKCEKCETIFLSSKKIRFCSLSCRASHAASFVEINGMKKLHNIEKFSKLITGRKLMTRSDGSRFWYKNDGCLVNTEQPSNPQ